MVHARAELKTIAQEIAASLMEAGRAGVLLKIGKPEIEAAVYQRTVGQGWSADQVAVLDNLTIRAVVELAAV